VQAMGLSGISKRNRPELGAEVRTDDRAAVAAAPSLPPLSRGQALPQLRDAQKRRLRPLTGFEKGREVAGLPPNKRQCEYTAFLDAVSRVWRSGKQVSL
jgi:hypothetical protein